MLRHDKGGDSMIRNVGHHRASCEMGIRHLKCDSGSRTGFSRQLRGGGAPDSRIQRLRRVEAAECFS